ncbi:Glutathione S-transferase GST-6.0 [wastewater metagenome]|uniref:Glutathione S-transferase GST-6.0 n=2 Tax=unclassified sequences TaxID=12908 RepID=A0A5B8RAR1_9ZZZZ|nr:MULTISPECIES: glutathione S-transferase family protein [Arhodomonas]MCS4505062.1 glutathione S-transferase family protein [Arhodomonas aquaeolei]QEA05860.1 glutathione S-transferase GST-6.0 [uncultured organism]
MTEQARGYCLYYSPDSANLIVRLVLEELGVDYRDVLVDRGRDEQRSEAYRRLNPQGLLPVLVAGEDEVLFETAAIVLQLADRHAALAPAVATPARGECYKWLFYLSNTLHADLRVRFYAHRYTGDPDAVAGIRAATAERVAGHFALLEDAIAAHGGDWLLPGGLSVCDFYLAVCARWAMIYPRGAAAITPPPASHPHLARLLATLEARPAVARACEREAVPAPFFTAPVPPRPAAGSVS